MLIIPRYLILGSFFLSLFACATAIADGRTASANDSRIIKTEIAPDTDAARMTFPEKKRHYDKMSGVKRGAAKAEAQEEEEPDISSESDPNAPAAVIVEAEPYRTEEEIAASSASASPTVLPNRTAAPVTPAKPKNTKNHPSSGKKDKNLTTPNNIPMASPETKSNKTFAPNLSDFDIDNAKNNKPSLFPIKTDKKQPRTKPVYRDDMPQSYQNDPDPNPKTKGKSSTQTINKGVVVSEPGYRSYTVTDMNEVEHLNMNCVVSVDQDSATGAFVIKTREDCK